MSKIAGLLDIREHEIVPCFMFSLLNFLIMAGIFLGRAARDSLFFLEVGAKWLPLAFVFNAIVLIGISLFFSRLSGIFANKKHRLFYISFGIFAVVIIAFGLSLNFKVNFQYYNIIYWIFFIFCEIALFVMMRVFWFFTEDYFTEQQMKRLSPKFVGSGQIGIGIGGILTLALVGLIGTANIIYIWLVLVLAAAYVSKHILKKIKTLPVEKEEIEENVDIDEVSIFDGYRIVKKSKYLKLFVAVTISAFVVASIFDVVLAATAEDYFDGDVDQLTSFLGFITIIFGFGAAAFQFLFMSRTIRRLGVGKSNLFAPALLFFGSLALTPFSFIGAAVSRILFLGNEYLFNQTLIVLIYNAVREEERSKVSFFIEGSVVNGTIGAAGAAIFLYSLFFGLDKLAYIAIIFSVVMLVAAWLLKDEYKKILIENLGARPPEDRNLMLKNAVGLNDINSEKLICDSLNSPDETTAIVTMNLVTEEKKDELDDKRKIYLNIASGRISDENNNVRLAAIKMIIELAKEQELKDEYFGLITKELIKVNPDGSVLLTYNDRATINAILDVYAAWHIGISGEFEPLLTYLKGEDVDKEIVGDLIIHLSDMGFMGIYNGIQLLNELMDSSDMTDLMIANRVLGELGDEGFHKDLTRFCRDKLENIKLVKERKDELEQFQEIIKAFAKIDYKNDNRASEAFELLIECLKQPVLKRNAVQSLESLLQKKPFLLGRLVELNKTGGWGIELKREIPQIVRSISTGVAR